MNNIEYIVGGAVAVVVIVAAGAFLLLRVRANANRAIHHARCPDCGQKVRYTRERSGKEAMCPSCKKHFNLPTTPQPLAKQKQHQRMIPGTRKEDRADS